MGHKHNIVKDLNTLKAMEKAGFIKLHHHTGKTVKNTMGGETKAWYVDYCKPFFEFKGYKYMEKYLSGCFQPFVYCIGAADNE